MRDGFEEAVLEKERARLAYAFDHKPDFGEALDVGPGVKWLRMPLGGSIGAINVWAIREGEGWAIVDTGLGGEETQRVWRMALKGPLEGRPVTRVFVTHMHPDHIGMAGYLTRKFGVRLWITRLESVTCRSLAADTGRDAPPDGLGFYRAAGWDDDFIETYRTRFGGFGRGLNPLPDSYRRLRDGDELSIGEHVWRVVVGSGHSPEHACLYCPDLKLMISGDQVLPRISSNVSVFPMEPEGDPLTDWLDSLASIKAQVPDDVLVLPAHNEPFRGLHARIDALIADHERGLARLRKLLVEPRRAVDPEIFRALFHRRIDQTLLGMATGESLAHLTCLITRGQALRERDAQGVDWYRAIA